MTQYIDPALLLSLLSPQESVPMREYATQWYESFKKKRIRPNTQATYENLLHKHIIPFFGDTPVNRIDVPMIQKFYDTRAHLSKSTLHQCSVILHQIFKAAIEDRMIGFNPTESIRLTYSQRVKTREALTDEEIRDVIRQLPRLKGSDSRMLHLLIYTGMRRGEVAGLRWEDIDFEENVIHVKRAVQFISNRPIVGETKSKAGIREVPLLPELKEALLKDRKEEGYIVGDGEHPITERAYICAFRRILRKMELHGATAHIFRHTFLTTASSSLDLKTLQSIAGHASHVTTMGYVHKRDELIRDAQTRLTGMFKTA